MRDTGRFSIGSIDCWVLVDGALPYPKEALFSNADPDVLAAEIGPYLQADGSVLSRFHCLLIRSGERLALIDAGMGDLGGPDAPVGMLAASLHDIGVAPQDIDVVIVSHGHPDHIGGLTMDRDGTRVPTYAGARHHIWQTEWDFWTAGDLAALPEMMRDAASLTFPPLVASGLVEPVSTETEVLPGVRVIAAPGHTPGHAAVAIGSQGESLLYLADAVVHELDFEHLDWLSAFDADPELTVGTRRTLLERARREGSSVVAFHVGRGRVAGADGAYRFDPDEDP